MIIEEMYRRHRELRTYLEENKELSFLTLIDEEFRRTLVLAIASSFEDVMQITVQDFVKSKSAGSLEILSLINIRFIKRQYHSWFDWEKRNVNKFWSFFGDEFKSLRLADLSANAGLSDSMRDFIELGELRNRIVHQNFALFSVDLSVEDIYKKYLSASDFIDYCKVCLI